LDLGELGMIIYYLMAAVTATNAPTVVAPPPSSPTGYTRSPDVEVPPIPEGSPGDWVNSDDYPSSALREQREGTVAFRLVVTELGTVSKCEITQSSGNSDLDTTACEVISKRAHFTPAKDKKGHAISSFYSSRVRWQIPNIMPIPVSGQATISFIIEKDGSVSNCKVSTTFADMKNKDQICAQMRGFVVAVDEKGDPVRKSVAMSNAIIVKDMADTSKIEN
jgi:TonB family protein